MNRAERRREKRQKNPTYNLNQAAIDNIKRQAMNDSVSVATMLMLAIPCMVMRDKYGYGKKRLERFVDECLDLFDSYNKGYVSFEDLHNCLKEETGVTIK